MISREEFEAKLNELGVDEERKNKCIEYYNDSTSKFKEQVIEQLNINGMLRWWGIQHSSTKRKDRTPKKYLMNGRLNPAYITWAKENGIEVNFDFDDADKYIAHFERFLDIIRAEKNIEELKRIDSIDFRNALNVRLNNVISERIEEITQDQQKDLKVIQTLIKEYNKKHNGNLIVGEITSEEELGEVVGEIVEEEVE